MVFVLVCVRVLVFVVCVGVCVGGFVFVTVGVLVLVDDCVGVCVLRWCPCSCFSFGN